MKEYLKKFKEYRKDPKKKSITLLIIYGIFFLFVVVYVRSNSSKINSYENVNNSDSQEITENISNYEYTYNININNNIIDVSGIYYNNQFELQLDDNYNVVDNNIIISNYQINIDTLKKLNYNSIKNFLDNNRNNCEIIKYNDDTKKYVYTISNEVFALFLSEENYIEGNVIIVVYEKKYIEKIDIDLKNYYSLDNYTINIKYENINNIKEIENNIE